MMLPSLSPHVSVYNSGLNLHTVILGFSVLFRVFPEVSVDLIYR